MPACINTYHKVAELENSEILEIVRNSILISRQNSLKFSKWKASNSQQQFLQLNSAIQIHANLILTCKGITVHYVSVKVQTAVHKLQYQI